MSDEIRFTEDHEWITVEDGVATIGITEYAKNALGELVYVELPEIGDNISAGDDFAVVESVKVASEVYSPIDGEVVEVNEALQDDPEVMKKSLEDGWIVKLKIEDESVLEDLMTEDAYEDFTEGLD
jgi:glycine cleavage system H protein